MSRCIEVVENPDVMKKRYLGADLSFPSPVYRPMLAVSISSYPRKNEQAICRGRFIVPIADLSAYARCVHILTSTKNRIPPTYRPPMSRPRIAPPTGAAGCD